MVEDLISKLTKKVADPFDSVVFHALWGFFIVAIFKALVFLIDIVHPERIKAWLALIYMVDKQWNVINIALVSLVAIFALSFVVGRILYDKRGSKY